MPGYATYRMNITVLTPLHIGNGEELLNEYDYAVHNGQTWRINEAALLEDQAIDDPAIVERLGMTPPRQLLKPSDFIDGSPYFRYILKGEPRSKAEGAQIHEQIKDIFDHPFLPGSSVKGALRTILGWYAWDQLKLKPDQNRLKRNDKYLTAKFASQDYERQIFAAASPRPGREPNYDLLRALQISDSQALSTDRLFLVNASVINRRAETGKNIPVELEAVRPETTFVLTLKLDLSLFSDWARQHGLKLTGENWLQSLPAVCRDWARQRIQHELAWFRGIPAANRLLANYQQLGQARLGGDQFLLQLGWGTGWDGKTYGARLQADPNFMREIINNYRMARGKREPNDSFPKSRRSIMTVYTSASGQRSAIPAVPLGWALVTLEPLHGNTGWMDLAQPAAPLLTLSEPAKPILTEAKTPPPGPAASKAQASTPAAVQSEKPTPPPPARKPIIEHFDAPPNIGDRFKGEIFDFSDKFALLSIPGLDDTQAYAVVNINDLPGKVREGETVFCEVFGREQEPNKTWKIICQVG